MARGSKTPPPTQVDPKISRRALDTAVGLAGPRRRPLDGGTRGANPFTVASHPPRATPPRSATMALDNALVDTAVWANQAIEGAFSEGVAWVGFPYLSALAQRPEYRVISEVIAEEMTRKWGKFEAVGDEDKTDRIKQLTDEFERLEVKRHIKTIATYDGLLGRSHLFIDVGVEGSTETPDDELKTDIGDGKNKASQAKVTRGNPVRRIKPVEATWVYPLSYDTRDPLSPRWYNPEHWYVMSREVHASRLMTFVGREVPDLLKPAYSFGGVSLSQMAIPYVNNWLTTRQSVNDLIHSFTVWVLKTNLSESLSMSGEQLFQRMELFNRCRDNKGVFMVDKDSEEFDQVSAQLGTLDQLQAQSQEHMAAVSRIPLVKLLGISPHGLNATAEPEIRVFYDTIEGQRETLLKKNMTRLVHFVMLGLWGEIDEEISWAWEPLWALDEEQRATVRKTETETAQIMIDSGVISQEEERRRVAKDPATMYPGLDPDDVPDLKEEEEQGLEPAGGRPDPSLTGPEPGKESESKEKEEVGEDAVVPFAGGDEFHEEDHPRRDDGKFGSGGSGAGSHGGGEENFAPAGKYQSFVKSLGAKLTPADKDDINDYAGDYAQKLNNALREAKGDAGKLDGADKTFVDRFDKIVAKGSLPSDTVLWRGVPWDVQRRVAAMKPGTVISDPGYTSTSASEKTVRTYYADGPRVEFGKWEEKLGKSGRPPAFDPAMQAAVAEQKELEKQFKPRPLKILAPAGTSAVGIRSPFAGLPGGAEQEVLLGRGARMELVSVRDDAIVLRLVGPAEGTNHAKDAEFHEADHPRDSDGKFGSGGGTSAGAAAETKVVDGERVRADGSPLPDHVRKLKIPPAWTNVRYSEDPASPLQVVGRDKKGRVQAIYSLAHNQAAAAAKFARVAELAAKFDKIVEQNEAARRDPKKRDAADALALVMATGIRPGSDGDTGADKRAYGATTLEGRHVVMTEDGVHLRFVGKKGVSLDIPVPEELADMLAERAERAGENGRLFGKLSDAALRDHADSLDGGGFKTKDFRTHVGTAEALRAVAAAGAAPTDAKSYKKAVAAVAKQVAKKLGNTPIVALQSYINPSVFAEWRAAAPGV